MDACPALFSGVVEISAFPYPPAYKPYGLETGPEAFDLDQNRTFFKGLPMSMRVCFQRTMKLHMAPFYSQQGKVKEV